MSEDVVRIGSLTAAPGSRTSGWLAVVNSDLRVPVTIINGAHPGPRVAVTGGTHGGEYPGIEAAIRLAQSLDPVDLHGSVVIAHPVSVTSFLARTQYLVPEDGKNLYDVYPGKARGTLSERLAYTVFTDIIAPFDFYLDLHGGDIHEALTPFVVYSTACPDAIATKAREAALSLGLPYVIGVAATTGPFGSAAVADVPALLIEIGQCGRWSETEVIGYLAAVANVLRYVGTLPGAVVDLGPARLFTRAGGVSAEHDGCWHPCVWLNDEVRAGDKVGEIRDFFGVTVGEYLAPGDGVIIHVTCSLAITAGDPLIGMVFV
jgi:predicted deacylase